MKTRRDQTRREYIARINRVLDHIRDNLDGDLSLQSLAGVASFSPFHFHRVFRSIVGENLNECIQRLRLERAAAMLKNHPEASITEIALDCGFSSSSNFARSFKRHFNLSASDFREGFEYALPLKNTFEPQNSKIGEADSNAGEDPAENHAYTPLANQNDPTKERRYDEMKVEVKKLPACTVAYVRVMDGLDSQKIKPAFQKVMTWVKARDLMNDDSLILGVGLDDPTVTPADKCRYDACVTVPPGTEGQGEVGVYDLPGGDYAVYRVEGSYAAINKDLEKAWHDLMAIWFPESGFQPDDRPCFEIYRETEEEMNAGKYIADLCEPVRPL